ncbi:MAG: hypothetical protein KA714_00015 [Limnoraphis sp. WC205]|jgi:hypothetical protein|nr:hypothetical protein [Limnoraphis sp. WC205]
MQTKYDSSSTPSETQHTSHLSPVKSVATSPLSPGVQIASKVALALVVLGSLVGSLMASPSPETLSSNSEEVESLSPSAPTEPSVIVVEDIETPTSVTSATPQTDMGTNTNSSVSPSPLQTTQPGVTGSTTDPTASPSQLQTTQPGVTGSTTTTTDPTASPSQLQTTQPGVTAPTTTTTDPTASPSQLQTTQPGVTAPTTGSTASNPSGLPPVSPTTSVPTASPNVETTQPTADITDPTATPPTQPDTLNPAAGEAGDGEIAASTPEMATGETTTAAAPSSVDTTELSQTLYNTIDSAWSSPVEGDSAYVVKLNSNGEIISYEPKTQVAKNNVNNTPLPTLVKSDATATEAATEFEVVFSTSGILEVKPPQ